MDKDLNQNLDDKTLKPRQHPGLNKNKCITVPDNLLLAIHKSLKDYPVKAVWNDGLVLNRYLGSRHIPSEVRDIRDRKIEIKTKLETEYEELNATKSEETDEIVEIPGVAAEPDLKRKHIDKKVMEILRQRTYAWQPINYDSYKSVQYLIARGAQEYAILHSIFSEIAKRSPDLKPRSFFDFGSGVGTGVWAAASFWKESLYEYFLVDSSKEMNELSEMILRDGDDNKDMSLKNVFYRQFLPASNTSKYDIVLSAFSLFELHSEKNRLEVLTNLWNKCDKYLILVENGSNAGFSLINEARNFILSQSSEEEECHVFAPCPHELICPRITAKDGTPCNFQVSYNTFPFISSPVAKKELYSYVVLKRGKRENIDSETWPRIVRPVLARSKHTVCRFCTKNGDLQEVVFTSAKNGR